MNKKNKLVIFLIGTVLVLFGSINFSLAQTTPTPVRIKAGWWLSFDVSTAVHGVEVISLSQVMSDGSTQLLIEETIPLHCFPVGYVLFNNGAVHFNGSGYIVCKDIDLLAAFRNLAAQANPPIVIPFCEGESVCNIPAEGVGAGAVIFTPSGQENPVFSYKHLRLTEINDGVMAETQWQIDGVFSASEAYKDPIASTWHEVWVGQDCYDVTSCGINSDFKFWLDGNQIGVANGEPFYEFSSEPDPIYIGFDPDTGAFSHGSFKFGIIDPNSICASCSW